MSKKFWFSSPSEGGQTYYRSNLPAKFLQQDGLDITEDPTQMENSDVLMFHRLLKPQMLALVQLLQKTGKKIIMELDDDLWHLDPTNPAYPIYENEAAKDMLNWMIENVEYVVASTQPLKDVINKPAKTAVLPNLLDMEVWPTPPESNNYQDIRILWAGSIHHEKDLEDIVDPIDKILREFPHVQMVFMGDLPRKFIEYKKIIYTNLAAMTTCNTYGEQLQFVAPTPLNKYPETVCTIAADIALCPLVDNTFNHSKSNIKVAEMSLAGAAVIATDLPPYQNMAGTLLVPAGDQQAWYEAIKRLIKDKQERIRLKKDLYATVKYCHTWQFSAQRKEWKKFFETL